MTYIRVDLDDYVDDIENYAKNRLGLKPLEDYETNSLMDELEYRGFDLDCGRPKTILQEIVLEKILPNLDSIPLEEFEAIIQKYNL